VDRLGQRLSHLAGAGVATSLGFDFRGLPISEQRQLVSQKTSQPDWSALLGESTIAEMATAATLLLDAETFSVSSQHDALGRVLTAVSPDGSELHYGYDEGGGLQTVSLEHRGSVSEEMLQMIRLTNATPLIGFPASHRLHVMAIAYLAVVAAAGCASHMGVSGVVLDPNLRVVALVPGPPSQAVVGVPSESSFAMVGWKGQVRIGHDDGVLTEQSWTIPPGEHLKGFCSNGDWIVTVDDQHVTWRRTLSGDVAGQLAVTQLDTAPASRVVRNIGVLTTKGAWGMERLFDLSGAGLPERGSIIDFSRDETMFSRFVSDDLGVHTEIYQLRRLRKINDPVGEDRTNNRKLRLYTFGCVASSRTGLQDAGFCDLKFS
jgi:YD repeat-containing protein